MIMMLIWTTNVIVDQLAQRKLFSLPSDILNLVKYLTV
jgi:hypothetical protein